MHHLVTGSNRVTHGGSRDIRHATRRIRYQCIAWQQTTARH